MKTYLALVEPQDGAAYGVTFPDLPGCFSAADQIEDLLANAAEALELWFEDAPLTEPGPPEAVRQAVAGELATGAFLVAVPYVRRTSRQRRVNLSLDTGTLDAIDTAAAAAGLTRSGFVAMAALNEIKGAH